MGSNPKNKLQVCSEQCDQCLFSKNRIVSAERMREILVDCYREDKYFECHKGSIAGRKIVCKGFYDNKHNSIIKIAQFLKLIIFVKPSTIKAAK